ncbi:hypothetical protein B0H21DRAFT_889230 [Amylocystis lapponica]|nr:hypothetical protein B0H21DRAFT_889230 [Amylocystis lapponica]
MPFFNCHYDSDTDDETNSMEDATGPDVRALYTRSMPNIPMRSSSPEKFSVLREKARSTTSSKYQSVSVDTDDEMQAKNEDALSHLKVELHGKIHREYPVQGFVKHVWNFDENDHPDLHLKISSFLLRPAAVDMYNNAPNQASCYPHLAAITDALLTHLFPEPMVRAVQRSIIFVQDNPITGTGEYASFQPDLTWSTVPKPKDRPWDWLLLFAEVKRAEKAPSVKKVLQGNVPHAESTLKSLKRKSPDSKDNGVEPPPKRHKQLTVSGQEAQTANYLSEMLSHGIRSFVSGFFIKDRVMHLWYGDRMGLVKSCAFDWQKEPTLMALVFAAVGTANLTQLGISPFLKFLPTSSEFNSYEDGHIVLPASEVLIGDSQKRSSKDMVFKIDTTRKVWTEWGAVGRGTTIVPLEAIGAAAKRLGTESLVAKLAWLHASRTPEEKFIRIVRSKLRQKARGYLRHIVDVKCLVTRNMEKMGLPRTFMDIELPGDDMRDFRLMVMKRYESLGAVVSADEFKTVFEHVVRGELIRIAHAESFKLAEFGTAHHWVWTTSGVLHRDISTGNIMFYEGANGHVVGVLCDWDLAEEKLSDAEYKEDDNRIFPIHPASEEDTTITTDPLLTMKKQDDTPPIEGLAEAIPEKHPPRPRYRVGTDPFLALEISLEQVPPFHRYRHDLESFFYVLVYVCAVFDPVAHHFGRLKAWEEGTDDDIALSKMAFLTGEGDSFPSTFNESHQDYRPLIAEWVKPLWRLFSRAALKRKDIVSLLGERNDEASMGRDHMVAKLDAEIAPSVTAWRKMITYEAFMECLGLTPHLPTDPQCSSCNVAVSLDV